MAFPESALPLLRYPRFVRMFTIDFWKGGAAANRHKKMYSLIRIMSSVRVLPELVGLAIIEVVLNESPVRKMIPVPG